MKDTRLTGLIAAAFTPFDADLRLRLEMVPKIASHLKKQGVSGTLIGGTTGEWASMTLDERRRLAVAWRSAVGKEFKMAVHVGHNCLDDCRDLARHAESIEADAIAALMPSFFRPGSMDALLEFCRGIASAAPNTPFYYYHIPEMTGVDFSMYEFVTQAIRSIPTFRGIKFTFYNLMDFSLTLNAAGEQYDVLFGRDEFLLAGLAMGASGAIGSTYNYAGNLYGRMMAAYAAGDSKEALAEQIRVQKMVIPLVKHGGGVAAGKAIMGLEGVNCGHPRPPLKPVTGGKLATLKADLDALDFFTQAGIA